MKRTWDDRFIELARHITSWSKDESVQVAAIVVGPDREVRTTGYNGFPRRVPEDDPAKHVRPAKYLYSAHAEENCVANAARVGVSLKGCIMYSAGLLPCATCARLIIQSGITELVVTSMTMPTRWAESMQAGLWMLYEAGVAVRLPNATPEESRRLLKIAD